MLEQGLRGKQREDSRTKRTTGRIARIQKSNPSSVKKKDARVCLHIYGKAEPRPRDDGEATGESLFPSTHRPASVPLFTQNGSSRLTLHSPCRPISSPSSCGASAVSQVSRSPCPPLDMRTQNPLGSLSNIHICGIAHLEHLIHSVVLTSASQF